VNAHGDKLVVRERRDAQRRNRNRTLCVSRQGVCCKSGVNASQEAPLARAVCPWIGRSV
jgi:hypothetical protein